jgi:fused signal recognition particle receptor
MKLFDRLKTQIDKTRLQISGKIDKLFLTFGKIDANLFDELEEILITSDIGVETTLKIIAEIKRNVKERKITNPSDVKNLLKNEILKILQQGQNDETAFSGEKPSTIIITGVNGVGKTTSIGKLANLLKSNGKSVLVAAADTYRAAAIDQLEVWAEKIHVDLIKQTAGSDPGAVVYDAIQSAKSRNIDYLICDTAGRLHTKKNLMEELKKVKRIIDRELPYSGKEVLLVVDATTGQNAVAQARIFKEAVEVDGIILTKLDGTAKGGIIIAIKDLLDIPVKYIGIGEKAEDLQIFNPAYFIDALF